MASTTNAVASIASGLIVAVAGGYVCGLAIDRYGEVGSVSLWALGALAGYVVLRTGRFRGRLMGYALVTGCIAAFLIAETWWVNWHMREGAASWWTAFTQLPTFAKRYEMAAVAGAILTALGSWSAFRQARGNDGRMVDGQIE
jgi:hypothetical protein